MQSVFLLKGSAQYYKNFCGFKVIETNENYMYVKAIKSGFFKHHDSLMKPEPIYKYTKGEIFNVRYGFENIQKAKKLIGKKILIIPECSLIT